MTCNCNHETPKPTGPRKANVKFCDLCDPCNENVTNVKICAFVVPTLEEGRYFKNSFIFVQEDDSVYFISDDRSEIPFGSRPKYIDNFDPTDSAVHFKSTVVYDLANSIGYVYGPDGTYMTISMAAIPFSSLTGEDGVIVTVDGGNYTAKADWDEVAKKSDLDNVTILVTNHTGQIRNLEDAQDTMAGDIETIEDDLDHVHDLVDDANELAVEAKGNAAAAQQTANDAMSTANAKQDALTAGENISIVNNVISATGGASYSRATTTDNGLMSNEDRKITKNVGIFEPASTATASSSDVAINFTKNVSDENGSAYSASNFATTIAAATQQVAGVMTAADKIALDNQVVITLTDTDPGTGGTLAANNFIAVYEV